MATGVPGGGGMPVEDGGMAVEGLGDVGLSKLDGTELKVNVKGRSVVCVRASLILALAADIRLV